MKKHTPSDYDKLPHKFIFDALRDEPEQVTSPEPTQTEAPQSEKQLELRCGTQAPTATEPPKVSKQQPYSPLKLVPEKKYFRVGEVAKIIGVEPHVLRYWQTEFAIIRPNKSGSGHWVYSRKDLQALHLVRHLLYVEKFSIKGAKQRLNQMRRAKQAAAEAAPTQTASPAPTPTAPIKTAPNDTASLKQIAKELKELIQLVRNTPSH